MECNNPSFACEGRFKWLGFKNREGLSELTSSRA
jgi:hypothetical protein